MSNGNLRQLVVNAINDRAAAMMRERMFGTAGSIDGKRCNAYAEYGFPSDINFDMLLQLYRRGGIASGAVNKLAGTCWRTHPWVIEGDDKDETRAMTAFDTAAGNTLSDDVWRNFFEADKRRLVGRYSALILQYGDNKKLSSPVAGTRNVLRGVMPVWQNAIKPQTYDTLGNAELWTYTGSNMEDVTVHDDRVIILGDYFPGAIAFLEAAYNNGVTLEKVEGGSGESFLKNAARQLGINFDKEIKVDDIARSVGRPPSEIQEVFDDVVRGMNRGDDSALVTIGANVQPITATIPDPRPTYDINVQSFCAAVDIPSRILIGNQSGERASTEDQRYFNGRCQSRRENELSYDARRFVARLIKHGALPPVAKFTVMWDDLTEQTRADRLANAKLMSDINATELATGRIVFTAEEIRSEAGFENGDDVEPLPDFDDQTDGE